MGPPLRALLPWLMLFVGVLLGAAATRFPRFPAQAPHLAACAHTRQRGGSTAAAASLVPGAIGVPQTPAEPAAQSRAKLAQLPRVLPGSGLARALLAARRVHVTAPQPTPSAAECAARAAAFNDSMGAYFESPWHFRPKEAGTHRLVVVSTGGSGTTYTMLGLYNGLYEYGWDVNRPRGMILRNWKHAYAWPQITDLLACQGMDRILYIFNEPVAALASLFRRGYGNANFAPWSHEGATERPRTHNFTAYVTAAVRELRDVSGRHQHLEAWLAAPVPCPTLYADFSTLMANVGLLADFLGVPASALSGMQLLERRTEDPRAGLPAAFVDLYAHVYEQMKLFDLAVRVPAGYVDPAALAAGVPRPIRKPPRVPRTSERDMPSQQLHGPALANSRKVTTAP
jgi:hypothetical protein